MSCVYIARLPSGLVKIGQTGNVASRINALCREHGRPIELLRLMPRPHGGDKAVGRHFEALRVQGELFTFGGEMLTFRPEDIGPVARDGFRAVMERWLKTCAWCWENGERLPGGSRPMVRKKTRPSKEPRPRDQWGDANPSAKLSAAEVRHIRDCGLSRAVLATRYGVSESTIWRIRARNSWPQ